VLQADLSKCPPKAHRLGTSAASDINFLNGTDCALAVDSRHLLTREATNRSALLPLQARR